MMTRGEGAGRWGEVRLSGFVNKIADKTREAIRQFDGRPTNYQGIGKFYRKVRHIWRSWLSRRTRGAKMTWEKYEVTSTTASLVATPNYAFMG
jgi:hypothetical protein